MKKIKKMPLVIASIIILVLIAGISIFFLNARETKNEEKTEPKVEEKNERDDEKEKETIEEEVIEEEDTPVVEEQPENNSPVSSNGNSSSSNGSSSSSNSNNNSSNNNYVAPTPPPVQNEQPQQPAPEPACTPKKFYTAFRADFDSMAMCQQVGNKYKEVYGYYGFICDYDMDDCGDTYYMLTMFDGNGNYIDYPNIPKP